MIKPEASKDCCETWKQYKWAFRWFAFEDFPNMMVIPYIQHRFNSEKRRVQYCPFCGTYVRDFVLEIPEQENYNHEMFGIETVGENWMEIDKL